VEEFGLVSAEGGFVRPSADESEKLFPGGPFVTGAGVADTDDRKTCQSQIPVCLLLTWWGGMAKK